MTNPKDLDGYGVYFGESEARIAIATAAALKAMGVGGGGGGGGSDPATGTNQAAQTKAITDLSNKLPANVASDRTTPNAPSAVQLSDGANFYQGATQITLGEISAKIGTPQDANANYTNSDDIPNYWNIPTLWAYLRTSLNFLSLLGGIQSQIQDLKPLFPVKTDTTSFVLRNTIQPGTITQKAQGSGYTSVVVQSASMPAIPSDGTFYFYTYYYGNPEQVILPCKKMGDPSGAVLTSCNSPGVYVISIPTTDCYVKLSTLTGVGYGFYSVTKPIYQELLEPNRLSEGTEITGQTLPSGSGFRGWISNLYQLISDRLPTLLPNGKMPVEITGENITANVTFPPNQNVTVLNASIPVSGTVAVSNPVNAVAVTNTGASPVPVIGTVTVGNPTSSVAITNLPATQQISGSVGVNNFPTTQAITGSVGINNLPATQNIAGSVNVANFPALQPVSFTSLPTGTNAIGSVNVGNFPATQLISAATLPLPNGAATDISISKLLTEGTEITGQVLPSGTGFRGWISNLYKLISDRLPPLSAGRFPVDISNQSVSISNTSVPVSGAVTVSGGNITITNPTPGPPATQAISAVSLPLPSGAATDLSVSKLLTEGTEITGQVLPSGSGFRGWISNIYKLISDRLPPSISGRFPVDIGNSTVSVGNAIAINNFPSSQQINGTISVSNQPSAIAVNNFPATQQVGGTVAISNQPSAIAVNNFPATQNVAITNLAASPVPITGTITVGNFPNNQSVYGTVAVSNQSFGVNNFPATQAISATALPLPTGAATDLNLGFIITGVNNLAKKGVAGSPSNVDVVAIQGVAGGTPLNIASPTEAVLNVTGTANILNGLAIASTDLSGYSWLSVQLTGTWSGTIIFEASNTNAANDWQPTSFTSNPQSPNNITQTNYNGLYYGAITGRYFRARVLNYNSGTIVATAYITSAPIPFLSVSAAVNQLSNAQGLNDGNNPGLTTAIVGAMGLSYNTNGNAAIRMRSPAVLSGEGYGRVKMAVGTEAITLMSTALSALTGTAINLGSAYSRVTMQLSVVSGAPATGFSCNLEGSLNGSKWKLLGTFTSLTDGDCIFSINQPVTQIRANLTANPGNASITFLATAC